MEWCVRVRFPFTCRHFALRVMPSSPGQYQGIDIDMTFAELATPVIPRTFNILDDEILRGVDPGTVMSLNGPRATELIRILVPETKWVARYAVLCSTGAVGCCGLQC